MHDILSDEKTKQFYLLVKEMRKRQKAYYASRKVVGSNKHLLDAAVKAEMDVDGAIWEIDKEQCLINLSVEEPEMSLF